MNRERKPLHQFLKSLKVIFLDIAKENKQIKTESLITTNMKIFASQLEAKKLFIFRRDFYFTVFPRNLGSQKRIFREKQKNRILRGSNISREYCIHRDCHSKLSSKMIDAFLDSKFTKLEDMKDSLKKIVMLRFKRQKKKVTCFCKEGFAYDKCLHKLALEIYLGIQPRIVLLLPNKKRGRKRGATKALEKDLPPVLKKKNNTLYL